MHMPFNCVLIVHIEYLYKFFIQQDVNVKLKIKFFLYFTEETRSLNHFQNKWLFSIDSEPFVGIPWHFI